MTTGIYKITETVKGRVYVGSGVDIENRWSHHRATLNNNEHHNSYLQRAWLKYGPEGFTFEIIETCATEELTNREQFWMDHYKVCDPKLGFNLQPQARSALGFKHTPETVAKIAEHAKERNARPEYNQMLRERAKRQWADGSLKPVARTSEQIEAVAAKLRGRKQSLEAKENMRLGALRRWSDPQLRKEFGDKRRGEKRTPAQLVKMSIAQQERRAREKDT